MRRNRPPETVEFDRSAVAALIAEAGRLLMVCVILQADTQRRVGAQIMEGLTDELRTIVLLANALMAWTPAVSWPFTSRVEVSGLEPVTSAV